MKKSNKGKKSVRVMGLHEIFIEKIRALLDVEQVLIKALPKMAKASTDPELEQGFLEHLEQTKIHEERLLGILENLEAKTTPLKTEAIRGLVKDAEWVVRNVSGAEALDANLIAVASYVEHYEMAGYTTALDWAREMEHDDIATVLEETLREEADASERMHSLALGGINERANLLSEEEMEEIEDVPKEEGEE